MSAKFSATPRKLRNLPVPQRVARAPFVFKPPSKRCFEPDDADYCDRLKRPGYHPMDVYKQTGNPHGQDLHNAVAARTFLVQKTNSLAPEVCFHIPSIGGEKAKAVYIR